LKRDEIIFPKEKLSEGVLKHRRQQHHKNARKELLRLQKTSFLNPPPLQEDE
jgi:hypothetical protein